MTKKVRLVAWIPKALDYKFRLELAKLSKIEKISISDAVNLLITEFLRNGQEFRDNLEKVMKEKSS